RTAWLLHGRCGRRAGLDAVDRPRRGPAEGALNSAVSAVPESSTDAGHPSAAHRAAIVATTSGIDDSMGLALEDEVELSGAETDRTARIPFDIATLAPRGTRHEPEGAVFPERSDTGDVRAAVGAGRGEPARVPVGPAGAGGLTEPAL